MNTSAFFFICVVECIFVHIRMYMHIMDYLVILALHGVIHLKTMSVFELFNVRRNIFRCIALE